MERKKSPASTRLGKLILPEKEALGKILSEIKDDVNTDESDLVFGPFFDIMRMHRGVK